MAAPRTRTQVACVRLEPYALWLVEARHPGLPVAVLSEGRRVVAANEAAHLQGVTPGLREGAALSRCPELHAEVVGTPTVQAQWERLLEDLYAGHSPRVHGPVPGTAYLTLTAGAARELAAALGAPVGLAATQEVALLAAQRARPGEVRQVLPGSEAAFLAMTPLGHLVPLGLSAQHAQRLAFLGLRDLRDLGTWSPAQRAAFLGQQGRLVADLLAGKGTVRTPTYRPKERLERTLAFDAPLEEPVQAEAALRDLLAGTLQGFRGRTCGYLTLHADTPGGRLSATRALKWPLDERGLVRAALLALQGTDALPLGVDAVTVTFSGFQQPSRQVGLWPDARELDAVRALLDRFPQALVRVGWRDVYAHALDRQFSWLDVGTGEERPHPNAPSVAPPTLRRAAVDPRAFFEGTAP